MQLELTEDEITVLLGKLKFHDSGFNAYGKPTADQELAAKIRKQLQEQSDFSLGH